MAFVFPVTCADTTTTTGTGTITLAGVAPSGGWQTMTGALSNGQQIQYRINTADNSAWEVGEGTYTTAGTTLSRTTVIASSNANALVSFAAGTKNVYVVAATALTDKNVVTVAQGGTGLATLTANNVILGNGASNPTFVAPGTTGNVLTSNGTTWQSTAPAAASVPVRLTFAEIFSIDSGQYIKALSSATATFYNTASQGSYLNLQTNGSLAGEAARVTKQLTADSNWVDFWGLDPDFYMLFKPGSTSGTTSDYFLGVTNGAMQGGAFQPISYVPKHMGIINRRSSSTNNYACSNANGTTQTSTGITAPNALYHRFYIKKTSTTNIKFYQDGTLLATHTTNLPTGTLGLGGGDSGVSFILTTNSTTGNAAINIIGWGVGVNGL